MAWQNSLFNWATSLSDKMSSGTDQSQYFLNYFQDGGVCGKIILYAVLIGILTSIVYYLLCRFSYSLAKRRWWLIFGLLVVGMSFFVNYSTIVGRNAELPNDRTGFYYSIDQTETEMVNLYAPAQDAMFEQRQIASSVKDSLAQHTEKLPFQLTTLSAFYALLLYFLCSLILKRWSIHAIAIPF